MYFMLGICDQRSGLGALLKYLGHLGACLGASSESKGTQDSHSHAVGCSGWILDPCTSYEKVWDV